MVPAPSIGCPRNPDACFYNDYYDGAPPGLCRPPVDTATVHPTRATRWPSIRPLALPAVAGVWNMSHFGNALIITEPHFANADPSFLASLVRNNITCPCELLRMLHSRRPCVPVVEEAIPPASSRGAFFPRGTQPSRRLTPSTKAAGCVQRCRAVRPAAILLGGAARHLPSPLHAAL